MISSLHNKVSASQSIKPAAKTASGNGTGVDVSNCGSAAVMFLAGTRTDGTHTPSIEESDDNSSFSATTEYSGTALAAITTDSVQVVSYTGSKRYIRAVVTVAGATTGAVYGAWVLKGDINLKS